MNSSKTQINLIEQLTKAESSLNIFFTLSSDLVCLRGQDGYFKQLNPAWKKVLGWSSSELLSTPWIEFVHPDDVAVTLRAETERNKEFVTEYENRYRHKDGSYCWLSWRVSQNEDGLCYAIAKDITAVKQAEESLQKRLELERLITTLSTQFINFSWEAIDDGINQILQVIGEFSGFDRSYVVLFPNSKAEAYPSTPGDSKGDVVYQWCAESVEPLADEWQRFSTEPDQWLIAKLRSFDAIQVSTLADLPSEANNMRLAMRASGTQSLLIVPMVHSNSLMGYVVFAALKEEKTWSDDIVAPLRIIGDIFANAINRKQVRSKFWENERVFRAVFNQTFQLSSILKLDGTVLEDNQTAMDFCQLDRSEVIGHPFWTLRCWTISPETQEQLKNAIAKAAAGNIVRYEVDALAPDDTVITIDFSLKPLKNETGQVELLIAEGRDLTAHKLAEQNLQRAVDELTEWRNRYEVAGQINGLLLYEWDSQTEEVIWGHNVEQVFGYSPEEFTGSIEQWMELIHPDDVEKVIQKLERAIATKEPAYIEYRMRQKDGTYITLEDKGQFYPDRAGNLNRMIGFITNVTERKQIQEALRESEERWKLALCGNNDGIWDWNIKTNEVFYLARWQELLGYEKHDLSNHLDEWKTRVHPDDFSWVMQAVQEYLDRKTPYFIAEYRMRCKDGSYKWILGRGQAVWDEIGAPVRMVGSLTDISDRKYSEEALKASEARFRHLCACSPVGIFLADAEGRCLYANPRLLAIAGLTVEEILKQGWLQSVHPGDREWVGADWSACARRGQECSQQYRFQTAEGIVRWIQARTSPMCSDQGQLIGHVGTIEDITDRKQAEATLQQALSELETKVEERTAEIKLANEQLKAEIAERQNTEMALRQSEEQFRRVFDEAPLGIALTGLDGRFFKVNQALQDMLGYTESELLSLDCEDITYPEDWVQKLSYLAQIKQGEIESFQVEERYLKKNQELLWGNLTSMELKDEAGKVLYGLGMLEDITERKQALEALQKSEACYRAIVEDQTELICRYEPDQTMTFVNDAYCRYFSQERSEVIGRSFMPLIAEEDQEFVAQRISSLSQAQPIVTYEHRVILPSGEIRWQQWTDRAVIFDEQGNIIEYQAVGRDITERKQAEVEIRKALEKEKELSELRSSFVSLVSHEFRTPLTTIHSSTELLDRYSSRLSDQKKQNHLKRIQSAVLRMTQLLEDILTIGKAEAGKLKFEPSQIDLVPLCREIVDSMQIGLGPHHLLNFVPLGDGTNAWIDEKLLGHIITNLLSNAIKYSPKGGIVQFDLVCTDSWATFRIQDKGIGIPKEGLEKLFESFSRANNVGMIPGTGLGLTIVKQCVELHGGKIDVESELGVGTTFTVTLPLR